VPEAVCEQAEQCHGRVPQVPEWRFKAGKRDRSVACRAVACAVRQCCGEGGRAREPACGSHPPRRHASAARLRPHEGELENECC